MRKIIIYIARKLLTDRKEKNDFFQNLESKNIKSNPIKDEPIFFTGTGRSGTHFLATIFQEHKKTFTTHLDTVNKPVGDAFEAYTQWYKLPISHQGFLNSRMHLINLATLKDRIYIESNPLLAFSLRDLFKSFNGKYVIVFREPRKVVESHYRKGWYKNTRNYNDEFSPGFEYFHKRPNHFFSRITPNDKEEFNKWNNMSRLGKVSWMWAVTYKRIFEDLAYIPKESIYLLNINDFNFESYKELCSFLSLDNVLDKNTFEKIVNKKPGKGTSNKVKWSEQSKKEFNTSISTILPNIPSNWNVEHWLFKNHQG
jgi:hypothetical protein